MDLYWIKHGNYFPYIWNMHYGNSTIGGINVPGYASIVAIISFLGGIQLMGIGIIGEYIGRIFIESKKRPIYVIRNHLTTEGSGNNEYG